MKSKTLLLLLALCLALAVAAYFVVNPGRTPENRERTGAAPLPELPVGEVAQIAITGPEASVTLRKGEAVWTVENRYGFPADFSKLTELVDKLREMKTGRSFPAADDTLDRLALRPPGEENVPSDRQATRVVLSDASGKRLADILLGKARETSAGSGGQYVKPAAEETIHLVDKDFRQLDTDPSEWLRKEILNVPDGEIARIRCSNPRGEVLYTLERPAKGAPPEWVNPPDGAEVIPAKVNSGFGALSGFRIEDVADPAIPSETTGFDEAPILEYRLFDGAVYTFRPGNPVEGADNNRYLRAEAAYRSPTEASAPDEETAGETSPASESPAETDTPPAEAPPDPQPDPEQRRAEIEKLNRDLSAWTYIVPGWKMDRLVTDPEAFIEKPEPAAETE